MNLSLTHWVTKQINGDELILFHWKSNHSVELFDSTHPIYTFINKNHIQIDYDSLSDEHRSDVNWLLQENFILNENQRINIKVSETKYQNDTLQLILLPAGEACNLACVYCYEDHADQKSMNIEHQHTLLKFIQQQNKNNISIEYFGGEPMLNMKFISQFSELLNKNNITYSASITTNGTFITESTLEKLYKANVKSFQITLDGYRDLHNKLRPSKNGSIDSYEKVSNALTIIKNSPYQDISVTLRLNVNSESISTQNFSLFTSTLKNLIPNNDKRFLILPKIISDYSSSNLLKNEQAQEAYCKTIECANRVTQKFEQYIDEHYYSASAALLTKKGGYSCYAGNPNSFVITPDLKVRKCTVALNDPINFVGYLNQEGKLQKTINFELWTRDYSDNYCKSCFLNNTCQGNSCPLANIKKGKKVCPPIKQQSNTLTKKVIQYYNKVEPYEKI